ncbi:MAG: biotin-dependent carboxyltransferase family protein [Hyphomicrobiales bacterium]|nr:biotin-dependent carboxyltransferase family protein [Hyphomicrobiales bacterium]
MIEVLSSTALATVQDLGRFGALGWGVSHSGAMDRLALAAGNILLGNDDNSAAVEIPIFPFRVRFHHACNIVLTGADHLARLDDQPLQPWLVAPVQAGQVLTIERGGPSRWQASRLYLCVAGGIDVPLALGSRSTQLRGQFGGYQGRTLQQGDHLPVGVASDVHCPAGMGVVPPALSMPLMVEGTQAIRVLRAAEYEAFTDHSCAEFWAKNWKITSQSDRYGYRLAGPMIEPKVPLELRSHGIVPGVIQVPHGGQPIIQMRDAQPSGGYPKIGTVIDADLWRLGQVQIGSSVRFVEVSWPEAVKALQDVTDWLEEVRRMVALGRTAQKGAGHDQ